MQNYSFVKRKTKHKKPFTKVSFFLNYMRQFLLQLSYTNFTLEHLRTKYHNTQSALSMQTYR